MALIIDANRCSDFESIHEIARAIAQAISERRIKLAVCEALLWELARTRFRRLILNWDQIGMIDRLDNNTYTISLAYIEQANIVSDDAHILALAHGSGCRLIYTADNNLIADFKNVNILRPKGKVIQPGTREKIVRILLQRHCD